MLNQYQDVHYLVYGGLNIDIESYSRAHRSTIGAPLPACFALMPVFPLCNCAGVATDSRANPTRSEHPILQSRLRRFEISVVREYSIARVCTEDAEATPNERVPVRPQVDIEFVSRRRNIYPTMRGRNSTGTPCSIR